MRDLFGWPAAALAFLSALGGLVSLVLPLTRVEVRVVEGTWNAMGPVQHKNKTVYQYEFDLVTRNYGNVWVAMSQDEYKLVRLCANTPLRPSLEYPILEIVSNESEDKTKAIAHSMRDNILQFKGLNLWVPLVSSTSTKVRLVSPLHDLGGVTLLPIDQIFFVPQHQRPLDGKCKNDPKFDDA